MQLDINPTKFARALRELVNAQDREPVNHSQCLEFLAQISNHADYRTMLAGQNKPQANACKWDTRKVIDWEMADSPATIPEVDPRRREYDLTVEQQENSVWLKVLPHGVSEEQFSGDKPALSLLVEINEGVPSIFLSNGMGDNLLGVFVTHEGLLVRKEERDTSLVLVQGAELSDNETELKSDLANTELGRITKLKAQHRNSYYMLSDAA